MSASDVLEHAHAVLGVDRSGWRTVKFGNVVRSAKVSVDPETSGLDRYVAGEHMATDDLHIRRWGTVGEGYLGPAFHRKFTAGQVLYGSRRTYLRKVAVADFDGICANTTFVLESAGDDLLPELLPFIMQTEAFTDHSVKNSKGSVNPYVNWGDIATFEFALPPNDEQRRIAAILWAADACGSSLENGVERALASKQMMLSQLTHRGLGSTALRQSKIGPIPEQWDTPNLGDLLQLCQYGLSIPANTTSTIPIFRMMNLEDGIVVENDMKFVELNDSDLATYRLERGDILFNRTNSAALVGKVGVYDLEGTHVFASYLIRVRAKPDRILPKYLNYFLNSSRGQERILAFATPGVSQTNINASNLKQVVVPLPSLQEQAQIIDLVEQTQLTLASLRTHRTQTFGLRKALINKLIGARHDHL
ncbi:MAG: restriction endonuclease subunit S [Chloroflexota bacterium]|nr:restriction endonuclease subunit S [Chloroflexota bacterium]